MATSDPRARLNGQVWFIPVHIARLCSGRHGLNGELPQELEIVKYLARPEWCSLKSTGVAITFGLWETIGMAKHNFLVGKQDEKGNWIGTQCVRCGKIAFYKDGKIPEDISAEECKREDASQAAARIVREATENR